MTRAAEPIRYARMKLSALTPADYNPRAIDAKAAAGLGASLDTFGVVEPIIWNERTKRIVGGHQRRDQLLARKVDETDVILVDLSEDQERALNVALNNPAIAGHFVAEKLQPLLDAIRAKEGVLFERLRLNELIAEVPIREGAEDRVPPVPSTPVTKPGDVWILGDHVLVCGDSTNPDVCAAALRGAQARAAWTDVPWNVGYDGGLKVNDGRPGRVAIENDALGAAYPAFVTALCARLAAALVPGAPLYMVAAIGEWGTIDPALKAAGFRWSSTIIWGKDSFVFGRSDYHRQYEPMWYGWRVGASRLVVLKDRKQADLWTDIPRPKVSEEHPTTKPVQLVTRALQNSTKRGDLVFEPFAGSGTTLIACEQIDRRCAAIELHPGYCDVVVERWQAATGKAPKRKGAR